MLDAVGLRAASRSTAIPHELSGGQRQRIVLARALMPRSGAPGLRRAGLGARRLDPGAGGEPAASTCSSSSGSPICSSATTCAVVRQVSHEVAVMYLGRIVEQGDPDRLFADAGASLYAGAGLGDPDPRAPQRRRSCCRASRPIRSTGRPGCAFHPRCPLRRRALPGRDARVAHPGRRAAARPAISPTTRRCRLSAALSRRPPAARHPDDLPGHHLRLLRPAAVGRSGDDDPVGRRAARSRSRPSAKAWGLDQPLWVQYLAYFVACAARRSRQLDARWPAGDPARARARAGDAGASPCRPSR